MFTLDDFKAMTKEGQAAYVTANGALVDEARDGEYNVRLFKLPFFYVEVWYSSENGLADVIKSFSDNDFLLHQFNTLSKEEQVDYAWKNGEHIDERMEVGNRIMLLQLPAFYVEIRYHPAKHEVEDVTAFSSTDTDRLQPYLELIDISIIKDGLNP